jgi:adenylosuccinate synthase
MDKTGRNGMRVGDILMPDFRKKYNYLTQKHKDLLRLYNFSYNIEEQEEKWFDGIAEMRGYSIVDSEYEINRFLKEGKKVLAEGAQGTMLDIDFGSYPFVTSSNTISAGACTGLGIAPGSLGEIFGVFKAYCTRVGSGPFPTELEDETGNFLREKGNEYGATTGRPRRCGWLDLVALKYAIMINGVTRLFMTKADILSDLENIKVCVRYRWGNQVVDQMPYDLAEITGPEYVTLKGWKKDLSLVNTKAEIPAELNDYIGFIEKETGVPVTIVSLGPDRKQIIFR